jgi:hypothetical protein
VRRAIFNGSVIAERGELIQTRLPFISCTRVIINTNNAASQCRSAGDGCGALHPELIASRLVRPFTYLSTDHGNNPSAKMDPLL